ncbi:MAG: zinc ribbon domain-containing protein [Clostridia bacterium]|nr:zinc ribbon domain-containing protein [Clostridia bacterium]
MRFCPECNHQIPDDALVCPGCGKPLAPAGATKELPQTERANVREEFTKALPDVRQAPAAPFRLPKDKVLLTNNELENPVPEEDAAEEKPKKKKKRIRRSGVMVPLMALVLVLGLVGAVYLIYRNEVKPPKEKNPGDVPAFAPVAVEIKNYVVYLSDGDLYYLDTDAKTTMMLAKGLTDDGTFRYDGTDIEFPEGGEALAGLGASVQLGADGKTLLFPVSSDPAGHYLLYYKDLSDPGAQPVRVAENVKEYTLSEDGRRVTWLDGGDALYQAALPDGEKTRLSDSVPDGYASSADGTHVVFRTADNRLVSYTPGEPNQIAANNVAEAYFLRDDLVYYLNHGKELYRYNGKKTEKIASGITKICAVYPGGEIYYLKDNRDKLILSDFIEDDLALSDAMISQPSVPVAPVFKDYPDMKAYNDAFDTYEKAYDAYEEQLKEYEEKQKRDELRRTLGESQWVRQLQTLCYFDGEDQTVLSERIDLSGAMAFSDRAPAAAFLEILPASADKLRFSAIDSIGSADAITAEIVSRYEKSMVAVGKNAAELGGTDMTAAEISCGEDILYCRCGNGALWRVTVTDGEPGSKSRVLNGSDGFLADPDNRRFVSFSGEGAFPRMSLSGRWTEENVNPDSVRFLDDGAIVFLADCKRGEGGYYGGTLKVCRGDVLETLADNVRMYDLTADGQIVCMRNLADGKAETYLCGAGRLKGVYASMLLGKDAAPAFSVWEKD